MPDGVPFLETAGLRNCARDLPFEGVPLDADGRENGELCASRTLELGVRTRPFLEVFSDELGRMLSR